MLTLAGKRIFDGALEPCGRIVGAYGSDWGSNYLRGNFTKFDRLGRYRVSVSVDGVTARSWPFEIGKDLLWRRTVRARVPAVLLSAMRYGGAGHPRPVPPRRRDEPCAHALV